MIVDGRTVPDGSVRSTDVCVVGAGAAGITVALELRGSGLDVVVLEGGGLEADPALTVGINKPYSPADQVYYTVSRHAGPRSLPAAMIEIRNDEIADEAGQRRWADRLAKIFLAERPGVIEAKRAAV